MPRKRPVGQTDASLLAFLDTLRTWDGNEPSFQEILLDAATHAAAICERNKDDTALVPGLADQTKYPRSLLKKWVAGKQLPPTKLAKTMVNEIRIYLSQRGMLPQGPPN